MQNPEEACPHCLNNKKSIFYKLSPREKEILLKLHSCQSYKRGELIYSEGDRPMALMCLSSGKVKIFKEGIGGREQIIRLARPTGFIGFRALFAEENYLASALALEDSVVCLIEKSALMKVIRMNGDLALQIIKSLAKELGFSTNRTITLTQKHIRGRLAESLLFLKDTYGFDEDGQTLKIYLSREDIANLSNMTTSNAIRTLSHFAQDGILELEGRKIRIMDLPGLQRISLHG